MRRVGRVSMVSVRRHGVDIGVVAPVLPRRHRRAREPQRRGQQLRHDAVVRHQRRERREFLCETLKMYARGSINDCLENGRAIFCDKNIGLIEFGLRELALNEI